MLIPKAEKHKNKKHLMFVSTQNCCVGTDWCSGNIQTHHLLKPFEGKRGFGMRASDKNVVPFCYYHHAKLHDTNGDEDKFWESFGLSPDYGRETAKMFWEKSPHKK